MSGNGKVRGFAATIVGWILVAVIVWFAFGFLVGTIRWILRFVVVIVVIGALTSLYFRLRD